MSVRKDFSSLRKHRPTGVQPKNLLGEPVLKIGVPTEHTINQGAIYVVGPADLTNKLRSQDIRSCFFVPMAIIDSGLTEDPTICTDVAAVEYNGTKITSMGERELVLNVSKNGEYLYFQRSKAYLDKMVIPKGALRHVMFSNDERNVFFILQKKFGLIYVNFAEKASKLKQFLQTDLSRWVAGRFQEEDSIYVKELYHQRLKKRENSNKDPQTVSIMPISPDTSDLPDPSDDVLRNGLPSKFTPKFFQRRKTRATTKMLEEDPELLALYTEKSIDYEEDEDLIDEDAPIIQETPAPFDPPLKYTLSNGKKFIIAYNDFKTLYNNDWINDTLIDFFIAYDIDRAANELKLISESEVYAFNSFFFTKLMSKAEDQETPDYYGNIRRWLNKIDLMSYESVVLPINEHLHWFCCVIKNLPSLLQAAIKCKENPALPVIDEVTGKRVKVDPVAEVFVFDSLRQSHSNIAQPLKTIISEYCKEKYGITIPQELIKVQSARVPKQRNFNDCGIHVIYNVRKWLSEPEICEKVWRKFARSQRTYFSGSERNNMRQACIDLLLDLHQRQPTDESSTCAKEADENHSDDEIELISYHSSKPQEGENEQEQPTEVQKKMISAEAKHNTGLTLDVATGITGLKLHYQSSTESMGEDHTVDLIKNTDIPLDEVTKEKSRLSTPTRTLDPRVLKAVSSPTETAKLWFDKSKNAKLDSFATNDSSSHQDSTLSKTSANNRPITRQSFQIEHPQVRRLCMALRLKLHCIEFLNKYFVNHSRIYNEAQQRVITEFVKNYNFFDPLAEARQSDILIKQFMDDLREPPAPIDEPFVIQEAEDSNGELNQSVSDLRISSDDSRKSMKSSGDTPEATRMFMREADNVSPTRHSSSLVSLTSSSQTQQRHTRSWKQQADIDSDLEVLGDYEVQILPVGSHAKPQKASSTTVKTNSKHRINALKATSCENDDVVTEVESPKHSKKDTFEIVSIPDEEISMLKAKNHDDSASTMSLGVRIALAGPKRRRVDATSSKVVRRAHNGG